MSRRRLLIATGSAHKLAELSEMLDLPNTDLVSLADVGLSDTAEEIGHTFLENAQIKADHYAQLSGLPTLADDSGIEVDYLDGRPGVFTRRYAGPDATDADNNDKLLAELSGVEPSRRTGRYRCVLVMVDSSIGLRLEADGTFEGQVALAPRGTEGFGYDPIFEPSTEPSGGRTVGQLSPQEKNAISHRAIAARSMRAQLIAKGY
ncbi:MAG TPA: RdgB/HAM1 family non-canonical purine NTP pyrophosphatase [Candidatus Limnocylindrales bacterium]|nr:RdgB/HAM1 family non-canonical purine NTP pyrophosphatase [Candidatus Limnocylindrales bacterium]